LPVPVRSLSFLSALRITHTLSQTDIYWLGLDENVNWAVSYPGKNRIREAMAMTVAMGGNTIRAHTLGVRCVFQSLRISPSTMLISSFHSTGHSKTLWPTAYNTNEAAVRLSLTPASPR
jgi:hypothetical protein